MIELSFNTMAGISVVTRPSLLLPANALTPDTAIPFATRPPPSWQVLRHTLSVDDTLLLNESLFLQLSSRDPAMEQAAINAVNDFTRTRMREDGFFRRIMPPVRIGDDELDRQPDPTPAPEPTPSFNSYGHTAALARADFR